MQVPRLGHTIARIVDAVAPDWGLRVERLAGNQIGINRAGSVDEASAVRCGRRRTDGKGLAPMVNHGAGNLPSSDRLIQETASGMHRQCVRVKAVESVPVIIVAGAVVSPQITGDGVQCVTRIPEPKDSAVRDSVQAMRPSVVELEVKPMTEAQVEALTAKTKEAALSGRIERFKTSDDFDGTSHDPSSMG